MKNKKEILLAQILGLYGLVEVPGDKSNAELLDLIKSIVPWASDDSTIAWCAILITWLFKSVGLNHLLPEKPLAARSWAEVDGIVVWKEGQDEKLISKLSEPGDLVVFWRGSRSGWQGHVGFYMNEYHYDRTKIRVIGGNQSNGILIRPYSKSRILKIIRL